MADLAELLADALGGVVEGQEEFARFEGRIRELEKAQDVRDNLVMRDNVPFVVENDKERR